MHIFIDESGIFKRSSTREWAVSCVGALTIPDEALRNVLNDFHMLKKGWGTEHVEIKGSDLNEKEIADTISLLSRHDVLFEVVGIDMQPHQDDWITNRKMLQARALTENLTDKHKQSLVEEVKAISRSLQGLTNQLYIQSEATFELIHRVIQKSTLYYSQCKPNELGSFNWTVDAKDKKITDFENLWGTIILPALQFKGFQEQFIILEGADYSSFERFCGAAPEPPENIKDFVTARRPFKYADIRKIFKEHFKFDQSHSNLGLQMVDILTNAIRRALDGRLSYNGWCDIGGVMAQPIRGEQHVIQMIELSEANMKMPIVIKPPYFQVIAHVDKRAKPLLLD